MRKHRSAFAVVLATMSRLLLVVLVAGATARPVAAQPAPTPNVAAQPSLAELPEPTLDPEAVRDDADSILADAKFKEPPKSLMQRLGEWFSEKLLELTNRAGDGGVFSALGWFLVLAFIAVIAFFVFRIGRTMRTDPGVELEVLVEPRRDPDEWRKLAEQCEARGEWKDALRCRYRALIGELVEHGVVRDIPGRTAGEYRQDLATAEPDIAPAFSGASDLFEQAWYGDLPTGPEENRRFRQLADEVLAGANR